MRPRAARAARGFVFLASGAVAACGGGAVAAGGAEAGAADGAIADAPLACPPAPLDEWTAPAYRHAQARQPGACSAQLVADFYQSCLAPAASSDACNQAWGAGQDQAHQTCHACLVTPSSASAWGPLVDYGTTVSVNVAGCLELLDPAQIACSASVQAADACQHQACDGACPVSAADAASFGDWQACIASTGQQAGECRAALEAATCAAELEGDAGPAVVCVAGKSFQDDFLSIAAVFCD
jgi:hypothetical protein